ncbi:MAG TPA: tetratricopeptide repeat protein [Gemmataceae bacterium]|nr:tetratricopeptide repeat protein [Gemmataceae bacterium]
MRQPLILDYYSLLPECTVDAEPAKWAERYRRGLAKYQRAIEARYNEATLERLLNSQAPEVRRAAVLALGLVAKMTANLALAARLHDDDPQVSEMAADALWSIWFRADSPENNHELQRLMRLDVTPDTAEQVLGEFQALIRRAPRFAEAYNQRAIVHFRLDEYGKAVLDCEKVLRLNPVHFGAAGGMAQCFMRQRKLRAALRCFRRAYRINPNLDGVPEAIQSIEKTLGDDGKR